MLSIALAQNEPDALQTYDEIVLASVVLDKCPLIIEGAVSKTRQKEIGKAAFQRLLGDLDLSKPGQHAENAKEADFILKRRTEEDIATFTDMLQKFGCAALEDRARKAIKLIR